MNPNDRHPPVAIVGLSARLPGSADVAGFWESLLGDGLAIGPVPSSRWDRVQCFAAPGTAANTSYSQVGGFIDHVDCFDLRHFGIAPREAEAMDPMQRLFLQAVWSALEDAGIGPRGLSGGKVGVFAGVGNAEYVDMMRVAGCDNDAYRATGMALTLIANRVSYLLNLRGPSQVVDTACSSSLVAVHRAVEQLHLGNCDLAVAGGISLMLTPELHVAFSQAGMLSTSDRCRPFDAEADGYVRGEGVGVVVLKRLDDALRDGDFVYATILGSAENHGGRAHSLTAPSFKGQAEVIASAWQRAGAALPALTYVEAHGTGTPLGDPIEIAGLAEALRLCHEADAENVPDGPIHVGALKSRIGHLEAAAGIAGLIKAVLSLRHGLIPANPALGAPNPRLELEGTPLRLVGEALPWNDPVRVAGVSSFGFGGVNTHAVLQSAAARPSDEQCDGVDVVVLSAKDEETLLARVRQLLDYLYPGTQPRVLLALQELLEGDTGEGLDTHWQPTIDVQRVASALRGLGERLGLVLTVDDVRDCLCWADVARSVSDRLPGTGDTGRLAARASLPRHTVDPSLKTIAASLFLGRDLSARRLLIVADSLAQLARQLAMILEARENDAPGVIRSGTAPRDGGDDAPFPGWQDGARLAQWLRGNAATPRLAEALSVRYVRTGKVGRVPLPTMPFRLDPVWFKSVAPSSAVVRCGAGTSATWPVAELHAHWQAWLKDAPPCLPTVLPWPGHFGGGAGAFAFHDVCWGAWTPGASELCADVDANGALVYRAGTSQHTRVVLRAKRGAARAWSDDAGAIDGSRLDAAALLLAGRPAWREAAHLRAVTAGAHWLDVQLVSLPSHAPTTLWTTCGLLLVQAVQLLFREMAPGVLLLPYRAATVQFSIAPAHMPTRLRLHCDPRTRHVDAWMWADGQLLAQVENMELRQAPWAMSSAGATVVAEAVA